MIRLPGPIRFIDIGINVTDRSLKPTFRDGLNAGRDLQLVFERGSRYGVEKIMLTGSDLQSSHGASELAKLHPNFCFSTVGCHPCSAGELFSNVELLQSFRSLLITATQLGLCCAIGEIGLDYERLQLADRKAQLACFESQLDLAVDVHRGVETANGKLHLPRDLPLFLHSRGAAADFVRALSPRLPNLPAKGVVHSFTGTVLEMNELLDMGLDIGINGCSLKSDLGLQVVREVPLNRLHLETDSPWCRLGLSGRVMFAEHAGSFIGPKTVKKERVIDEEDSMVKGRNEPCTIGLIAEAVAIIKGVSLREVTEVVWQNTNRLFRFGST